MLRPLDVASVGARWLVRTAGSIRVQARRGLGLVLGLLALAVAFADAYPAADDSTSVADRGSKRPLRLADVFDSEQFSDIAFSPDGGAVAFIRRRAESSQVVNGLEIPQTREDVWLQSAPGQEVKNLTNGARDSSGWWSPRWSPDGQYLTMLSSRGGNVTPWVWERRTGALRQLSQAGVEFRGPSGGCRWLADRRMLCLAVAAGKLSTPTKDAGQAVEYHSAMWQKVRNGELAVSRSDSVEFKPGTRRLVQFDMDKGTEQEVATVLFEESLDSWWASPDGSTVAFIREGVFNYSLRWRFRMGFPASLDLRRLDGRPLKMSGTIPSNVLASTVRWRPDSQALAFFALGSAKISPLVLYGEELSRAIQHEPVVSQENPAKLWELDLRRGQIAEVKTGDLDLGREMSPPSFQWVSGGEWLFIARRLSDRAQPHKDLRPEWLVLNRNGAIRNLHRKSAVSFRSLESVDGGQNFLSLAQSDLWSVDVATGTVRNLTESFEPPVVLYTLPNDGERTSLVLKAGEPKHDLDRFFAAHESARSIRHIEGTDDYILDLHSGSLTRIGKPEPMALLQVVHAPTRALVYELKGDTGTRLWRGSALRGAAIWEPLASANGHYQHIAMYEERLLEYTTANGDKALAKVTFPLDYVSGRKYPVVVDSDIGYERTSYQYMLTRPGSSPLEAWNARVYASMGYIYMYTSTPTKDILDDSGRGNLLLFTNGLLPAVDAAIAAGFADPDRFVLYGASSFGFGVLGIVTQTARFKAAVAQSSWSDQYTFWLTLSDVDRYSDDSFDKVWVGAPYLPSNLPFWRNGEYYRRNSPLTYVDRVRTPTLIIHHEFDPYPISQAEMFFSALVQQRKAARFLRYYGEEHGLRIPANVRDCYRQIFAWFDEYADVERDQAGRIVFDGNRPKSRNGRPALTPGDFKHFGPAAIGSAQQTAQQD